jgi:hypothetical protein
MNDAEEEEILNWDATIGKRAAAAEAGNKLAINKRQLRRLNWGFAWNGTYVARRAPRSAPWANQHRSDSHRSRRRVIPCP